MAKSKVSDWVFAAWRFVRVFLAAGIAQAVLVHPDWLKPEEASKALAIAFVTGVISAVFKYARDKGYLNWFPL